MRYALRGRRLLFAVLIAVFALPATAGAATPASCDGARPTLARAASEDAAQTVRCLINRIRARHGLRRLGPSSGLTKAALRHSRDMVRRGFFDHDSPGGGDMVSRARAAGYIRSGMSWTVGENIAWGSGSRSTPAAIVEAWMDSPGHRRNILSPAFRDLGVGVVAGTPQGGGGATYTTDFGARG